MIGTPYNPDILSCIANLSNDEVFTPPAVANAMLDLLPQELFSDPNAKFLDPACKSGVFLREIAKRLIKGLEGVFPNLEERLAHIYRHQLYGIAITELTAQLTRRGLYCSRHPSGPYSVAPFADTPREAGGNVRFRPLRHTWEGGKCAYCGASRSQFDRPDDLESHAYEFIHIGRPQDIFKMKFDVIIGNPPYQLSDGGNGGSAMPIYHKFVEQSKKIAPRYLVMITPSRWFAGGRGLDNYRKEMLHDRSMRCICDYPDASDCFPGVEIKGGVSYFLWDRDNHGDCDVITISKNGVDSQTRSLLEHNCDTFIRYNKAITILHKVQAKNEKVFETMISPNDPFGYDVRVENSYYRIKPEIKHEDNGKLIKIYYYGWQKEGIGYIERETVRKNTDKINKNKIFISRAYGAGESFPHQILGVPFIASKNSVCTETYLMIGPFDNEDVGKNILSYIATRFFRFLVMLKKNTQSATPAVYQLVPLQDFSKPWTDEELYAKYGLDEDEIAFIESMIKPMDLNANEEEEA